MMIHILSGVIFGTLGALAFTVTMVYYANFNPDVGKLPYSYCYGSEENDIPIEMIGDEELYNDDIINVTESFMNFFNI